MSEAASLPFLICPNPPAGPSITMKHGLHLVEKVFNDPGGGVVQVALAGIQLRHSDAHHAADCTERNGLHRGERSAAERLPACRPAGRSQERSAPRRSKRHVTYV